MTRFSFRNTLISVIILFCFSIQSFAQNEIQPTWVNEVREHFEKAAGYNHTQQHILALKEVESIFSILNDHSGLGCESLAMISNLAVRIYRDNGCYDKSIKTGNSCKSMMEDHGLTNTELYADCLYELAETYKVMNMIGAASELNKQSMNLYMNVHKFEKDTLLTPEIVAFFMAQKSFEREEYTEVIPLAQRYLDTHITSEDSTSYIHLKAELLIINSYNKLGEVWETKDMIVSLLNRIPEGYHFAREIYVGALRAASECCLNAGLYKASVEFRNDGIKKAMDYGIIDSLSVDYAKEVMCLGDIFRAAGEYQDACNCYLNAMMIFVKHHITDLPEMSSYWSRSAFAWEQSIPHVVDENGISKPIDDVERHGLSEASINKSVSVLLGKDEDGINMGRSLTDRGRYYYYRNILDSIPEDLEKAFKITRSYVVREMMDITPQRQALLWNQQHHLFDDYIPRYVAAIKSDKINSIGYNAALLFKGILLGTSQLLNDMIYDCNDKDLISLYQTVKQDKELIMQLYEKPENQRPFYVDSLQKSIIRREDKILNTLKDKYSISFKYDIDYQAICKALKKDEIAIEFLETKLRSGEDVYVALIAKYDYPIPHKYVISHQQAEDNIWLPLQQELVGIQKIYFSPAGRLYNIPIESQQYLGNPISDKYQLFRLSSTREILNKQVVHKKENAVLYGGISYNLSVNEMIADKEHYPSKERGFDWRNPSKTVQRGSVPELIPLPQTKKEVLEIKTIMNNNKIHADSVKVFMEKNATEASLKALDNNAPSILHIATHGYYIPKEQEEGTYDILADRRTNEDRILVRSGVYMAGAQNSINNTHTGDKGDDGILTALEISLMNLKGLDLVTLSACETALGDISGDGVLGLQRGFKKAGTQSILMSLWEVDDEATCLLMTEFYKNWIGKHKTKHDALESAKQAVRSHKEKGWDNPKYWAAFVLLDALD